MTVFATCRGCASKEDCAKLKELKAYMRGHNVSMIRHRCPERLPEYLPGDPVTVRTGVRGNEGEWYPGDYPAVFLKETGTTRVICFIRPGTRNSEGEDEFTPIGDSKGFMKVSRSRLQKRDGERVDLTACSECSGYPALTGKCEGEPGLCPFKQQHKEAAE